MFPCSAATVGLSKYPYILLKVCSGFEKHFSLISQAFHEHFQRLIFFLFQLTAAKILENKYLLSSVSLETVFIGLLVGYTFGQFQQNAVKVT